MKWTPRHQLVAEVAAACGVGMAEIGRTLGADPSVVREALGIAPRRKGAASGAPSVPSQAETNETDCLRLSNQEAP